MSLCFRLRVIKALTGTLTLVTWSRWQTLWRRSSVWAPSMERAPTNNPVLEDTRVSETSTSPPLASQVGRTTVKTSSPQFSVTQMSSKCTLCFSLRVSSWWPHPQEVLGSDPGPSRRALQRHLVISTPGASNRPSLRVFYVSEQPGKLHWFSNTGLKLRREKKQIK